jgi:hypothetical protein
MADKINIMSDFLKVAQAISNIKKQEVPLPIAKKTAIVGTLRVGDDLSLKTSLVSPVNYDREMSQLIHSHTEFMVEEGNLKTFTFEEFCALTSNLDKMCLIWALYKTTYETLGQKKFKCEKEQCKHEHKEDILLDDLVHDDSFVVWEEELPFYEFVYPIEVVYEGFVYGFDSRIPSIRDNNRLMSNLSIDALQSNLNQTGSVFTRTEQIALLTKTMTIRKQSDPSSITKSEKLQEILIALQSFVPHIVSEKFFKDYSEKFDKYYPKFYTEIVCPQCQNKTEFRVELETEFFRRSVFDRG